MQKGVDAVKLRFKNTIKVLRQNFNASAVLYWTSGSLPNDRKTIVKFYIK